MVAHKVWRKNYVSVYLQNIVACNLGYSHIEDNSLAKSLVLMPHMLDRDRWVFSSFIYQLLGLLGRAIVCNDYLVRQDSLCKHTSE